MEIDKRVKQHPTSGKIKAGCSSSLTSKQKHKNQLRSDNLVGFTPAQILPEDRCGA